MPAHEMEDILRSQGAWVPAPPQEGATAHGAQNGALPHIYNTSEEVVISGISARLPESDNMEEFRQHLMLGEDMVTEDDRRWQPGRWLCEKRLAVSVFGGVEVDFFFYI